MTAGGNTSHILFVNRFYYPDQSATARLLTQLTVDLAETGGAVTVITGRFPYGGGADIWSQHERYHGIAIHRVWSTNFGRRSGAGRLIDYLTFFMSAFWAVLWARSIEWLVVMADPPMLSILAAVMKYMKPCRTMCWLQDVFPQIAIESGMLKPGLLTDWISCLARWSLDSLDRVVVVGRCMEQGLVQDGLNGRHVVRISNWADGAQIYPASDPFDRHANPFISDHGLQHRFVLMYSGNVGIVHDIDTIEQVFAATAELTQFTMCIVGDGVHMPRLRQRAEEKRWSHVKCLPYQPEDKLRDSLTAADVHLVTLRPEMKGLSVPSKIYGILAAGRPLIFIGPAESEAALIVCEAQCGYVVTPGDVQGVLQALIAYYHDPRLVQQHGRLARAYFEAHCSRSMSTNRFMELLRSPSPFAAALTLEPSAAERNPFPERFVHR